MQQCYVIMLKLVKVSQSQLTKQRASHLLSTTRLILGNNTSQKNYNQNISNRF